MGMCKIHCHKPSKSQIFLDFLIAFKEKFKLSIVIVFIRVIPLAYCICMLSNISQGLFGFISVKHYEISERVAYTYYGYRNWSTECIGITLFLSLKLSIRVLLRSTSVELVFAGVTMSTIFPLTVPVYAYCPLISSGWFFLLLSKMSYLVYKSCNLIYKDTVTYWSLYSIGC